MITELLDYILNVIDDDSKDWREVKGELRTLRAVISTLPSYYQEEAVRAVIGVELKEEEDA